MNRFPRLLAILALSLCVGKHATGSPVPAAAPSKKNVSNAIIRRLSVWANHDNLAVEIYASREVTAQTQTLSAPDRVVIDFPGTLPGSELRGVTVNRGQLKAIRVGLLQTAPAGTRVVLDLNTPQQYQVVPKGNKVVVKIGSDVNANGISAAGAGTQLVASSVPSLESASAVLFKNSLPPAGRAVKIGDVRVLEKSGVAEIEITASGRIIPRTQILTGPNRLVVDFPNAVPRERLSGGSVNRAGVKAYRMGLFKSSPPVTRLVFDLETPQQYQVFPSASSVIVRIGSAEKGNVASRTTLGVAAPQRQTQAQPLVRTPQPSTPPMQVRFNNGLLSLRSEKATLAQVLDEVRRQTGADIELPAGAEQERVAADLGPGPAKEVLASFLHGSRYNFVILGSDNDENGIQRVILSPNSAEPSTEFNAPDNTAMGSEVNEPANDVGNPAVADVSDATIAPAENPAMVGAPGNEPALDQRGEPVDQPMHTAAPSAIPPSPPQSDIPF